MLKADGFLIFKQVMVKMMSGFFEKVLPKKYRRSESLALKKDDISMLTVNFLCV
jgi:hypothetical protein